MLATLPAGLPAPFRLHGKAQAMFTDDPDTSRLHAREFLDKESTLVFKALVPSKGSRAK
jgi:hypothetical protein